MTDTDLIYRRAREYGMAHALYELCKLNPDSTCDQLATDLARAEVRLDAAIQGPSGQKPHISGRYIAVYSDEDHMLVKAAAAQAGSPYHIYWHADLKQGHVYCESPVEALRILGAAGFGEHRGSQRVAP